MPSLFLETGAMSDADAERAVDEELDDFDAYFRTLQKDRIGLSGPERAIIKTFCAYLLGIGPNNPRNPSTSTERKNDAPKNRS
jgi:hypothetical protein